MSKDFALVNGTERCQARYALVDLESYHALVGVQAEVTSCLCRAVGESDSVSQFPAISVAFRIRAIDLKVQ
jgi:hypothetical protein